MKKVTFFLITLVLLCGCEDKKSSTSLRFDWIANMNFVGDIYAAKLIAPESNFDLKCEEAGFGVDPVKMVISDQSEFGIVSLEQLYLANEKGADLVAIGVINDISPVVFISKADKPFSKPTDFEGKTVGLNPGGATEFVYRTFINVNKLDKSKIKEIPVDFDLKTFINNKYDVRLAFGYVEPLDLKLANEKFFQISPIDFGLKFPGRVYFTKRSTIEKKPELVQKFISTVAKGWELALADEKKSIELLSQFSPKIDKSRETESLKIGKSYFVGYKNQVLTFDKDNIANMAKTLVEIGLIKNADFVKMLNTTFIDKYHSNK